MEANIGLIGNQIEKNPPLRAAVREGAITYFELFTAGLQGLQIGIMKFDRTRKTKVSTSVCSWILSEMQAVVRRNRKEQGAIAPGQVVGQIARARNLVRAIMGGKPTDVQIAAAVRLEMSMRSKRVDGDKKSKGRRQRHANEEAELVFRKQLYAEAKGEAEKHPIEDKDALPGKIGKIYNEMLLRLLEKYIDEIEKGQAKARNGQEEENGPRVRLDNPATVARFQNTTMEPIFEHAGRDDGRPTRHDHLVSEEGVETMDRSVDMSKIKALISKVFSKLKFTDQKIIGQSFGIGGYREKSSVEIGHEMGMNRKSVNRCLQEALARMRSVCHEDPRLRAFAEEFFAKARGKD